MREIELVIIGGGAAGMAAACAAYDSGIRDILILERNDALGGVLHQCIHNGFGLHRFREDLTGVEFAARYEEMVLQRNIPYLLRTFVIELTADRVIRAVHPQQGLLEIHAGAIVLAMGCRERSRNALLIPGTRGAGILTAGTAQKYLNIDGYLPGRRVVILGSGDIGLIMARQFVLEGASVEAVVEIMPYSSGLARNMKQCIEDFDIPVYYNSTISRILGRERVNAVRIAQVDARRQVLPETEFEVACDLLMISAGLIPENELTEQAGIRMARETKGACVTEDNQTSVPGIFACGNVLHVHDLVDFVAEEGEKTGRAAAAYLRQTGAWPEEDPKAAEQADAPLGEQASVDAGMIAVLPGRGVGGIVPQNIHENPSQDSITLLFRPADKLRDAVITVRAGKRVLRMISCQAVTPAEMCRAEIPVSMLSGAGAITVDITSDGEGKGGNAL